MSNKLHINKVRVLELPTKQYQGEAYYEGSMVVATIKYLNKANCIKTLNSKIEEYNLFHSTNIPLMKADGKEILYGQLGVAEPEQAIEQPENTQGKATDTTSNNVVKQETTPQKLTKPKRKPFTPYGLNGYLVDNQGNIRLMLDRRANAHTIVLEPEMFAALADMVKRTQEQKNG